MKCQDVSCNNSYPNESDISVDEEPDLWIWKVGRRVKVSLIPTKGQKTTRPSLCTGQKRQYYTRTWFSSKSGFTCCSYGRKLCKSTINNQLLLCFASLLQKKDVKRLYIHVSNGTLSTSFIETKNLIIYILLIYMYVYKCIYIYVMRSSILYLRIC